MSFLIEKRSKPRDLLLFCHPSGNRVWPPLNLSPQAVSPMARKKQTRLITAENVLPLNPVRPNHFSKDAMDSTLIALLATVLVF